MQALFQAGVLRQNEEVQVPVALESGAGEEATGLTNAQITVTVAKPSDSSLAAFAPTSAQWTEKGNGLYLLTLPGSILSEEGCLVYRVEAPSVSGPAFRGTARVDRSVADQVWNEPASGHAEDGTTGELLATGWDQYDARTATAYDDADKTLTLLCSLQKNGQEVLNPTSVRVRLKLNGETTVVDESSAAPNADGVFKIVVPSLTLDADSIYEILTEVVYGGETYRTVDSGVTFN